MLHVAIEFDDLLLWRVGAVHLQQLVDCPSAAVEVRLPERAENLLPVGAHHGVPLGVRYVDRRALIVDDLFLVGSARNFCRPEHSLLQSGADHIRDSRGVVLILAADLLVPLVDESRDGHLHVADGEPVDRGHLLAPGFVLLAVAGLRLLVVRENYLPFAGIEHQDRLSRSASVSSRSSAVRKQRKAKKRYASGVNRPRCPSPRRLRRQRHPG